MSALRLITLSAAALALAACTTPRAATSPPASAQQPVSALPQPTSTTDLGPRPRPRICDRPGTHRVPAPDVLNINELALDGDQVLIRAKPTTMVCGPRVANDAYFEPAPGPAKTYRLTDRATVALVDMTDGPGTARYSAASFVELLRATPELSLDNGHLDPHFRSFRTATVTYADDTKITTLAQGYKP
ncbi:unnamed protein product [[Actinomadura] parvosata subsp. kistnae]|uniref:DUF306 domain-containing protein n=2 Tax=Nonomuraea TaxID=83681 RepID=A0A1V0AEF2_9ACTN|nr:hypothetical protein BKM31_50180 [Nonomuraea sp. ATCC 55076]SPL92966.1 unnamed protein product [Actinomadura parvosata subsp. kistnae]